MVTGILPPVISYELAAGGRHDRATLERREQRDGTVLWGIFEDSRTCLIEPGCWTYEAMPSSRTDEYIATARRPFDEALELWRRHLLVACAGGTWGRQVAGSAVVSKLDRVFDPTGLVTLFGDVATQPGGSLPFGSWVGEETLALTQSRDARDASELAMDVDCTVRRTLALLGDAWRTEGRAEAVVATAAGFHPDVRRPLVAEFREWGGAKAVAAIKADLDGLLAGREALRIAYATLARVDGEIHARIMPKDA